MKREDGPNKEDMVLEENNHEATYMDKHKKKTQKTKKVLFDNTVKCTNISNPNDTYKPEDLGEQKSSSTRIYSYNKKLPVVHQTRFNIIAKAKPDMTKTIKEQ